MGVNVNVTVWKWCHIHTLEANFKSSLVRFVHQRPNCIWPCDVISRIKFIFWFHTGLNDLTLLSVCYKQGLKWQTQSNLNWAFGIADPTFEYNGPHLHLTAFVGKLLSEVTLETANRSWLNISSHSTSYWNSSADHALWDTAYRWQHYINWSFIVHSVSFYATRVWNLLLQNAVGWLLTLATHLVLPKDLWCAICVYLSLSKR